MKNWSVYIIRCKDNSLYTGITTDIKRRLKQHNGIIKGGAKYTRNKGPFKLEYLNGLFNKSEASKKEISIKKKNKEFKEKIIILNRK